MKGTDILEATKVTLATYHLGFKNLKGLQWMEPQLWKLVAL